MKKISTKPAFFVPFIILGIILSIAAFLRLYRIGDYMSFLGDEGRDALVVKQIIVDHKFTLLGPITSVGLMHLGPMYYYFMVPFLWLSRLDPAGPAVMVALFSLGTIMLIWQLLSEFYTRRAAFIASILYSLSPLVIIHAHSSWNPNILPFWALLIIYSLLKIIIKKDYRYTLVCGASLGIAIQLHYVALIFFPIVALTLLLLGRKIPIKYILAGIIAALVLYSPYILFEIRHEFINTKTVLSFVTRSGDAKTFSLGLAVYKFWDLTVRLFWRPMVIVSAELTIALILALFSFGAYVLSRTKSHTVRLLLLILGIWFVVGIGGLSLYTGNTYDYYLLFIIPLPFIMVGIIGSYMSKRWYGAVVVIALLAALTSIAITNTPILKEPNRIAAQTKEIAEFIIAHTSNQPFNFALLTGRNSDHAYRYYLEIYGHKPVVIKNPIDDPQRLSVTDQLFIVCEEKECHPLGHPLWEIAGFGRAEIADQWHVGLFEIFRLTKYTEAQ